MVIINQNDKWDEVEMMFRCIILLTIIMCLGWILSLVLWWRLNHLRDKRNPEEKITSMLFNPKSGIFSTADKIVLIIAIAILSYFAVQIPDEWMYA